MFYQAGFIESWGRGISKVCKAFSNANLLEPSFENFWNGTLVQMPRKQVDQLDELVNDQVKSPQLTDNEKKVLSLLKERDQVNDQVNTGYIAQQLNLSYSTVKRVLRSLKQRDMIHRVGSDKSGYWRIKE